MRTLRARIGRFEAPIDYGEIRRWVQRVRAGVAFLILTASVIGWYLGIAGAWFAASLATVVMIHALVRSRTPHTATEVLVIEAIAIALALGVNEQSQAPLIAATAYLIAATVTFGGVGTLLCTLTSFGLAIAIRPFVPIPGPATASMAGVAIDWVTTAVFLGAVTRSVMTAATETHKAKRVQGAALEAEHRASEMKDEFVSMVTLELRTPLTNIDGFAETLQDTWQDLEPIDVDEFLQIIMSESKHLKNLVEDVLAIPRLEAGTLLMDSTDFALRPASLKVVDLLFPEGGTRSASVSIGSNVIIHADPNQVEQILRCLVDNARKYGGENVSVEAIPLGEQWQIVVSDNGTGLPDADTERVFGKFEQVTAGDARIDTGFGLSLTVARHLVNAQGGRIWYEPGFPVGARFCFTLPAEQEKFNASTVAEVA